MEEYVQKNMLEEMFTVDGGLSDKEKLYRLVTLKESKKSGRIKSRFWPAHNYHPIERFFLKPIYRLCGGDKHPVFSTLTTFMASGYLVHCVLINLLSDISAGNPILYGLQNSLLPSPTALLSTGIFAIPGIYIAKEKKSKLDRLENQTMETFNNIISYETSKLDGYNEDIRILYDAADKGMINTDEALGIKKNLIHEFAMGRL